MMLYIRYLIYVSLILFSANIGYCSGKSEDMLSIEDVFYDTTIARAQRFIRAVRDAVNENDRPLVADLFNCNKDIPCSWVRKIGAKKGEKVETHAYRDFIKHYDEIINADVKYILNNENSINNIWAHPIHGFTMCNGCIWFWSNNLTQVIHIVHNCPNPIQRCNNQSIIDNQL